MMNAYNRRVIHLNPAAASHIVLGARHSRSTVSWALVSTSQSLSNFIHNKGH